MIKVGVFYPLTRRFEWDYYLNKHTPMVKARLGAALKKVEIEAGIGGGTPTATATYCAICQLGFQTMRGVPDSVRAARAGDHQRHRELHRRAAGGAGQRGEDVARTGWYPARQRRNAGSGRTARSRARRLRQAGGAEQVGDPVIADFENAERAVGRIEQARAVEAAPEIGERAALRRHERRLELLQHLVEAVTREGDAHKSQGAGEHTCRIVGKAGRRAARTLASGQNSARSDSRIGTSRTVGTDR